MSAAALVKWTDEPQRSRFSLAIEAGCEEMWFTLRDMPRSGFTALMLGSASGASTGRAEFYLTQLARKGIAVVCGITTDQEPLYAVARVGIEPEVLNDQGQPDQDYHLRRVLWTALRHQRNITLSALWGFAQVHLKVSRAKVLKFITRLMQAGYVQEFDPQRGEHEPVYYLIPRMNTGRTPPRFCEAELVYDVNERAFYGKGLAHPVAL
jgi:hypothetical protein